MTHPVKPPCSPGRHPPCRPIAARMQRRRSNGYARVLGMTYTTAFAEDQRCLRPCEYDPYNAHLFSMRGTGNILAFFELPRPARDGAAMANTPAMGAASGAEDSGRGFAAGRQGPYRGRRASTWLGPTHHGIFKSIYFFDPNGHRVELAADIGTDEQYAELARVAPVMLEEWSQTKKAPRHADWLHELARKEHAAKQG